MPFFIRRDQASNRGFLDTKKIVQRAGRLRRGTRELRRAVAGLWRALTGLPLLEQVGKILLGRAHALADLDQRPLVQLELVAVLHLLRGPPVVIADIIPLVVVDHDPLVERVVAQVPILPSLGLAPQVVCVETPELDYRRGVRGGCRGGHGREERT